jgi:hypothetical protein
MVGGTIFFERSSGEDDHRWVIQREISRVLVLNPLWQKSGAQNTGRILLSLTPPSLLSRGTLENRSHFCRASASASHPRRNLSDGMLER